MFKGKLAALVAAASLTLGTVGAVAGGGGEVHADAIYTLNCGTSRSARLVTSTCPTRWNGAGPQLFKVRTMCSNAAGVYYGPLYGPYQYGGNYIASSVACPTSYPTPVSYYIVWWY